jgi:hypothetical protein
MEEFERLWSGKNCHVLKRVGNKTCSTCPFGGDGDDIPRQLRGSYSGLCGVFCKSRDLGETREQCLAKVRPWLVNNYIFEEDI